MMEEKDLQALNARIAEGRRLGCFHVATGAAGGMFSHAHFTAEPATRMCTSCWGFGETKSVLDKRTLCEQHCPSCSALHTPEITFTGEKRQCSCVTGLT